MAIRTVIVEDEDYPRRRLSKILSSYPELEIVGEAVDVRSAVGLIEKTRPDLIFLDIRLPGGSGFDILAKISYRPMVVFVTAYDEFAIRAFEVNAVDYLLKPVSPQGIDRALQRALARRNGIDASLLQRLRAFAKKATCIKRFAVEAADGLLILPESEVYCFRAQNKGVLLCTFDREYPFAMTLKELDSNLDPDLFLRVHKNCIVALDKVRKIHRWFHGELVVELADKTRRKVRVGRTFRDRLKKALGT